MKSFELPLDQFPFLTVRRHGNYHSKLSGGDQDLVGDYLFYSKDMPAGRWTFRAEALLPDRRSLFCIEFSQYFDGVG